ncbi:hypothetical protein ACIKTA_09275 [Hansschlegelia beijingensis]
MDDVTLAAEIGPCFVESAGRRTDSVALACTHFPLLTKRFRQLAPWPVDWIDPAPAVARRVVALVGRSPSPQSGAPMRALFTSERPLPKALEAALESRGLAAIEREPLPLE